MFEIFKNLFNFIVDLSFGIGILVFFMILDVLAFISIPFKPILKFLKKKSSKLYALSGLIILFSMILSGYFFINYASAGGITYSANVSVEYLPNSNVYHIWNNKDDYYINATSGIQLTNHYDNYWTQNLVCFKFWFGAVSKEYCGDTASWTWTMKTDNMTYANLTGTTSISDGGFKADVILEYYLTNNSDYIRIRPTFISTGKSADNSELKISVHNIRIGGDYQNDILDVPTMPYRTSVNLSDISLNQIWYEDNLSELHINVFDNVLLQSLDLKWDDNVTINGINQDKDSRIEAIYATEPNAPINLIYSVGAVNKNDIFRFTYWWHDATPVGTQSGFRWCKDDNAEPATCWANQNINITNVATSDTFRFRVQEAVTVTTQRNLYFSIYYKEESAGSWAFPSSSCTGAEFCFFDGQATEGNTVTAYKITNSNVAEHYTESNPSAKQVALGSGQYGEWDFAIKPGTAVQSSKKYVFKMVIVTSAGVYSADLDAYTQLAALTMLDLPPTFKNLNINTTPVFINKVLNYSVNITDDSGLSTYKFSYNGSGASCNEWVNSSPVVISGTSRNVSNITLIQNTCLGKSIHYKFFANDSINQWSNSSEKSFVVYQYGRLNVSISSPSISQEVPQYSTFNVNATMQCIGTSALCGNIYAYARYNKSLSSPNVLINKTLNAIPFYIYGSFINQFWDVLKNQCGNNCGGQNINGFGLGDSSSNIPTIVRIEFTPNVSMNVTSMTLSIMFPYYSGAYDLDVNVSICSANNESGDICTANCTIFNGTWRIPNTNWGANNKTVYGNPIYISANRTYVARFQSLNTDGDSLTDLLNIEYNDTSNNHAFYSLSGDDSSCTLAQKFWAGLKINGTLLNEGSNPIISNTLSSNELFNVSWLINATGSTNNQYLLDVLFNSSYGNNSVETNVTQNRKICIGTCPIVGVTQFSVSIFTGTGYCCNLSSNSSFPGNQTFNYTAIDGDIYFNMTQFPTQINVSPYANGATQPQDSSNAIFRYCNSGETTISSLVANISTEGYSTCITLHGGTTYESTPNILTNSSFVTIASSLAINTCQDYFLMADFINCNNGNYNASIQSQG